MASSSTYPDPDAQMGGSGLYGNQNGGTPPAQQQQHMSTTDPELQLQENLAHLQRSSEMMHSGVPQGHQMNPAMTAAHHQFQTPPRPTHSPQQMAQTVMSLEDQGIYSDHDGGSRKRSKVSRACDECRRKKIRCDATSENGPEACSSCKRTGARCQFSRQPMKRGPSKGYIKELADRLNSLENQIHNPHAPGASYDYVGIGDQGLPETQSPSSFQRKRTHSMSEGLQDPYGRSGWPGQDRDFTTNGQNLRRPSFSDMTLAGNLMTGSNEGVIKAYYSTIHPILPILPHESTALNRLTSCPPKLRESFFLALESAVRSFSPSALPLGDISINQLVQQSSEALEISQRFLADTDPSRQIYNHLVYCQTLVFLTFPSDKPATGAMGSTAELLGRIAGRVSELGLNDAKVLAGLQDQDTDSYESARRLFWVAVILDRFHASSRTKDIVLPLHCGSLSRDDFNALGEVGYHLARAADIVGQVAFIIRAGTLPNLDSASPFAFAPMTTSSPEWLYLHGQLNRFRESLDITNLPNNSPPHLAFQYLRILVARLSVFTVSKEILSLTKELLTNLTLAPISPLHHIFASLVATSLTELSERVETQSDALACIKEMDDSIVNGNIIHRSTSGSGWDTAIRELLHQKKGPTPPPPGSEQTSPVAQPNMAGLQHLAAAAVGEREVADAKPPNSGNEAASQSATDVKHDVTAAMAAATEAAAAQATAAAAQKQLQNSSSTSNGSNNPYDPSALVKDGFMTALT